MNVATSTGVELRTHRAVRLMQRFAERTGLTSALPAARSLWTDALAVCNLISLEQATGEKQYLELASHLVDEVHLTLGERQHFHSLTKWMHALDQLARRTQQPRYNQWARELAAVAFAAFSVPGEQRLVWKMSIDLSLPLVSPRGRHDALDGLITCAQLQWTAACLGGEGPSLQEERAGFQAMARGSQCSTTDPSRLGGLLTDAWRVGQLQAQGVKFEDGLLTTLLSGALEGLADCAQQNTLSRRAACRLPFRELGLAVGLRALEHLARLGRPGPRAGPRLSREDTQLLEGLHPAIRLAAELHAFWLKPEHREEASWLEHRDLNDVTLATSLCPLGYLELSPPSSKQPLQPCAQAAASGSG